METREIVRKHYKDLRKEMSAIEIRQRSEQICKHILSSDWYQNADIILGYYPLGKEVNILPVLEHALVAGKVVALPRTDSDFSMDFYKVENLDTDVTEGTFHIVEPLRTCELWMPSASEPKDAVIVLVPGVVFDKGGNRYGYGRGFYDRYFARYGGLYRVGIAYALQISDEKLEVYPTDVKMHRIVTDKEEIKA